MHRFLFAQVLSSYVLNNAPLAGGLFIMKRLRGGGSKSICKVTETGYSCHAEVR